MKKFQTPELDVIRFEIEDVIATSPTGSGDPIDNLPEEEIPLG